MYRNFDSIHNWNGILSIDSLLKIAKTTRTKIKTTDALPCQCIWMSPLWRQPHTQAGVEEVFSCSFCLRRLAMPEWWGQTIRMPRLFCFTFNLNLKPMSNYYCENCGHRFADVRQILPAIPTAATETATSSTKALRNTITPANNSLTPLHISCKRK